MKFSAGLRSILDKSEQRLQRPSLFSALSGEALEEFNELVNELDNRLPLVERQATIQKKFLLRELIERNNLALSLQLDIQRDYLTASKATCQIASIVGAPIDSSALIVSPRLLMTSFKMLPKADLATNAIAKIRFKLDSKVLVFEKSVEYDYQLDPDTLFIPCEELDFTLVALVPTENSPKLLPKDINQLVDRKEAVSNTIISAFPTKRNLAAELINFIPVLSSSKITKSTGLFPEGRFVVKDSTSTLFSIVTEAARNRLILDWIRNKSHGMGLQQKELIREFFEIQSITPLEIRPRYEFLYPLISQEAVDQLKSNMRHFPLDVKIGLRLDMYSGRTNPGCQIPLETGKLLVEALANIFETTKLEPSEFAYLGYRGFWIEFPGNQIFYVPARLSATAEPLTLATRNLIVKTHRLALEILGATTNTISSVVITETLTSIDEQLRKVSFEKKKGDLI